MNYLVFLLPRPPTIKVAMKKIIKLLFLGCLLLFVYSSGLACASEKTYVISYGSGTHLLQFAKDRVKAIYERAGLKADFISLPLNRSILSANDGLVDGEVARTSLIEKNMTNLRRVGLKIMDFRGAAYTIDPKINVYDESLLTKYRVGYVLGVRWSDSYLDGVNKVAAKTVEALFEMLLQGRIDLALVTEESADHALHAMGFRAEKVRQLEPLVFSSPLYHYVHKKNADIIPRLEQAIKEINEEGIFVFYSGIQSPLFEILQLRLQEAFSRIGKICEVHSTGSSQRALLMANERGDGDALRIETIKTMNPEMTDNLLMIPESIGEVEFSVYTKGKPLVIDDWNSLEGLKNGLRIGANLLELNIPESQTRLPNTDRLFLMLAEDRLDTVTEHGIIADYRIQKLQIQGITKLTPPLANFTGYSFIHKKHEALIPALAASLAAMKKDGRFMQIEQDVVNALLSDPMESAL
jgi:polar amino acid transport system substrate-binding protein